MALQFAGGRAETVQPGLQFGPIGSGNFDSRRRDRLCRSGGSGLRRSHGCKQEKTGQHLHTWEPLSYSDRAFIRTGAPDILRFTTRGEVAEWSIAPASKAGVPLRVPGVRISPSPPVIQIVRHIHPSCCDH